MKKKLFLLILSLFAFFAVCLQGAAMVYPLAKFDNNVVFHKWYRAEKYIDRIKP